MSTVKTHPLEWVSLGFAVVALSHTEWSLAVAAGAHPLVAVAVPGALDVYAIRAMRARRHVPLVVLAMLAVNAMGYLVKAGVLPMSWPVLIAVSAIAPLTFAAVHKLGHGNHLADMEEARKRALWDVPQDAELAVLRDDEHVPDTFDAHALSALGVSDWGDDWRDDVRDTEVSPEPVLLRTPEFPEDTPERAQPCAVLTLKLPDGFKDAEHDVEHTVHQRLMADRHATWFHAYTEEHGVPPLREVKKVCSVSTDTARAMLQIWSTP